MAFSSSPATRRKKMGRICLDGISGSGKSFTGLAMLRGIVGPKGKIGVIDTEGGSILAYAGLFPSEAQPTGFEHGELSSASPDSYVEAIEYFVKKHMDAILIDSGSHEWNGEGGVLEMVDAASSDAGGKFGGGWRKATPKHNAFLRAFLTAPAHIVMTLRAHDDYVVEKDEKGKSVPRKVGLAPIARKGTDYEFDFIGRLELDHVLRVNKSRMHGFLGVGDIVPVATDANGQAAIEFGQQVRAWLDTGDGEWVAPAYRKSFYVGDKEIISAGIDRPTYVKCMNLKVALERVAKGESTLVQQSVGKAQVADCTQDEGEALAEKLDARIKEMVAQKGAKA